LFGLNVGDEKTFYNVDTRL